MAKPNQFIRNFCIIAHIDHGKSTIADRIMELTGQVSERDMEDQLLDSMDLERERGITIKLTPVRMYYTAKDGNEYEFNLIDTPGTSISPTKFPPLAACEGAILVVDATQGIEAQTLANVYLALEHDLEIVPVINKIDLPSAEPEATKREIEDVIGLDASYAPLVSAKRAPIYRIFWSVSANISPRPTATLEAPLKALIFDSYYDNYKGVILFVRVKDGCVKVGDTIKTFRCDKVFDVTEVGVFSPKLTPKESLQAGEVVISRRATSTWRWAIR
ncbi:MAG: GTP-binding protein [Candidatus Borkfalkia sp.]